MNKLFFTVIFVVGLVLASVSLGYSGGSGEPNDPYQIAAKADLLTLADTTSDYNKSFILTADINMQGEVFTKAIIAKDTSSSTSGFQGTAFKGIFDGNGYKISNFAIIGGTNDYLGLFGRVNDGRISNLGIENFTISGYRYTGGLSGQNSSGKITNCYSTGDVNGTAYVGGLIGQNGDSVANCYSTSTVSGTSNVGGLIGQNGNSITNCYSTGAVSGISNVGGLIGGGGSVINSYFLLGAGPDNGLGQPLSDAQMKQQSSFIGWDFLDEMPNGTCEYWYMPVGGYPVLSILNGFVPPLLLGSGTEHDPYIITDVNDLGTVWYRPTAYYILANDINLSGITWSLSVVPDFSGVFDGNDLEIDNLFINGAGNLGLFGETYLGSCIKNLGLEDCNVSGIDPYVGALVGYSYYGNISDCYSSGNISGSSEYVGAMVGYNYYGNISNCCSIGTVSGFDRDVGGLVGCNRGGNISNCYSEGTVSGTSYRVGGLVGDNWDGVIRNCSSAATISSDSYVIGGLVGCSFRGSISLCSSTGAVSGHHEIGGLAGRNERGSIDSCYSTVNVSSYGRYAGGLAGLTYVGSILDCYSTGTVDGNQGVGGLIGQNLESSISNCYSTGAVSGTQYVGALAGSKGGGSIVSCYFLTDSGPDNGFGQPLTDQQMKQQINFVDWDFINVWNIGEFQTYPFLRTYLPSDINKDDETNFYDLAILASHWLEQTSWH